MHGSDSSARVRLAAVRVRRLVVAAVTALLVLVLQTVAAWRFFEDGAELRVNRTIEDEFADLDDSTLTLQQAARPDDRRRGCRDSAQHLGEGRCVEPLVVEQ